MNSLWGVNIQTLWLAIGFFLLAAELLTTGFVFIFLGIGALLTAILLFLGIELSISAQVISFVLLSFGTMLILRKPLQQKFNQSSKEEYNDFKGQSCEVLTWNSENQSGTVKYRGTQWQAMSSQPFQVGQLATIESIDGITLTINSKG
jgi:membrane protein implicated in regulation of membrane protease activity